MCTVVRVSKYIEIFFENSEKWACKKEVSLSPPLSLPPSPSLPLSLPSLSLSHRQNDSLSKVKYRHDRRNYSYISRIIFIMRISNKCQNAQWDILVSNGGFCCHCIFQTDMLVSSYRQLKISSSFLCFVYQIYGDIHLAQIFCIPNSVSLFLTHLFRLLGDI